MDETTSIPRRLQFLQFPARNTVGAHLCVRPNLYMRPVCMCVQKKSPRCGTGDDAGAYHVKLKKVRRKITKKILYMPPVRPKKTILHRCPSLVTLRTKPRP